MRLDTGIVILSMHKDRRYVSSLPLSETHGWAYLLKQNVPDMASVLRAIQGSVDGMVVLDPEVVESLQPKQGSRAARLPPKAPASIGAHRPRIQQHHHRPTSNPD